MNMRIVDYPLSYIRCFAFNLNKFSSILRRYRNTYRNYFKVLLFLLARRFPIEAVLRSDGSSVLFNNHKEVAASSLGFSYETDKETLFVKDTGVPFVLKFYNGLYNGDVLGVFVRKDYSFLPVKEKIVIDIGANIADSSLYFVVMGAKRVIAIEPFPQNFEIARKNIEINDFSNKIDLILAGCSSVRSQIKIDPLHHSDGQSHLSRHDTGIMIPLLTLEDLLLRTMSEEVVLKIDCEGCEYDSVLSTPREVLMKFSHIQIEYHHGYTNLKKKLEESGFNVAIKPPLFERRRVCNKSIYVGYVYATNRNYSIS